MDSLGNRIKTNYENIFKTKLVRRTPAIIRIDGKSFHSFTKRFKKPFDHILITVMQNTTLDLCKNIQNVKLGYCQSDEISLLLCDYDTLETSAWFDYEVQKLCSVSASLATMYFNKNFKYEVDKYLDNIDYIDNVTEEDIEYGKNIYEAYIKGACFDSRCFNIPKEEVTNYFFWRQLDATRNSIQMVGQHYFKHKELQGVSCNNIQNKLLIEKGINWNNYSTVEKRGTCCIKDSNNKWIIDTEIPIFKEEGREYIERHI